MLTALVALVVLQGAPETVVYSHASGEELHLDLYRPKDDAKVHSAVLVIHGGGWLHGDKRDMDGFAKALVVRGLFVASVQYRLAPKSKWPAQLDDVQTAVRYLRANAKELAIDSNKIGSCGASAGGHLAQYLGVRDTRDKNATEYSRYSSKVKAVWNIFGPIDMTQTFSPAVDSLFDQWLVKNDQATRKDASPFFYISKRSAPTYFLQGKKDPLVPWQQAVQMADGLRKVNVEADLHLIDDMEHSPDISKPEILSAVKGGIEWMVEHLR